MTIPISVVGVKSSGAIQVPGVSYLQDLDGNPLDLGGVTDVGATIHAAAAKTTPVDGDEVGLVDSAASNVLKKTLWSSIKETLKTYFDALYLKVGDGLNGTLGATTPASVAATTGAFSGQITNTRNGAASTPPVLVGGTWFAGGTSTTTKPQLLVEPTGTTSTTWSTAGTGLGVNAPTGFNGNFIDCQLAGSGSRFSVNTQGIASAAGLYMTDPFRRARLDSVVLRYQTSGLLELMNVAETLNANLACGTVKLRGPDGTKFLDVQDGFGTVQIQNGQLYIPNVAATSYILAPRYSIGTNFDTFLERDSANSAALRNATSPHSLAIYGTYTDINNWRRLKLASTTAGAFSITAEGLGTGATSNVLTCGSTGLVELIGNTGSAAADGTTVVRIGSAKYGRYFEINNQGAMRLNALGSIVLTAGSTIGCETTGGDFLTGSSFALGCVSSGTLRLTGNLTASGSAKFTEQTYTPTATTQTIDLNSGNLNTLSLGSTTGDVTLTLTVPTSASSGRIKIIQHGTTARNVTIALSSLTAKWFSAVPAWSSQATGKHTVLAYTRDGSFMNFSAVEEA